MIVKVQLPLAGADLALIYNEDRSVMLHIPPSSPLIARMRGKLKAFFHVDVAKHGEIEIGEAAPWQEW